jgi:phosphocarrier protein
VIERQVVVVNSLGLHARPAAQLVKLASEFESHVEVEKDAFAVNCKSIMGVMMLAAECGSTLSFRAEGPDETEVVEALVKLVGKGFGE